MRVGLEMLEHGTCGLIPLFVVHMDPLGNGPSRSWFP